MNINDLVWSISCESRFVSDPKATKAHPGSWPLSGGQWFNTFRKYNIKGELIEEVAEPGLKLEME